MAMGTTMERVIMAGVRRTTSSKILLSILTAAMYGVGILSFFSMGSIGDGKLYMLSFAVLTSAFFGMAAGIAALSLGLITTAGFESGIIFRILSIQPHNWLGFLPSGSDWIVASAMLAVLGAAIVLVIATLIKNLKITIKKHHKIYEETERKTARLEQEIVEATENAERRLIQIRTAADIARSISSLKDPTTILQQVVDQIQLRFSLYYVGVFLVDESQNAVLKAGTGQAGQKMIAAGHQLQVGGTSMIGWCIANRQPRIALDVGKEPVRFNNPALPETRSELALPILSRGESLGALTIQSTEPGAFDENDIRVLQGITDSLAIALENAILFEKTQQSLEEIRSLNQAYLRQGWTDAAAFHGEIQYTFENKNINNENAANLIQVPMILRDQVIGQISLETDIPNLSPEDLEFVEAVTTQTAIALENARLIDETQRKAFQEETVSHLSAEFSRGVNIEEIITNAVKELSRLPAVSEVSIFLGAPENVPDVGNNGHHVESAA